MKFIPTLLISIFTALLAFLVVMQQKTGNLDFIFGAPPRAIGDTVYQFDPEDVGRIHILNHDGTRAEVIKAGGAWMLKEPWKDYADARTVRSLIDFAARLQIEDIIERDDVDDLAQFGLKESRIEVELFDKKGSPLCHFRMGRYTDWRGFDPQFKSEDPTQAPPSFPTLIIRPAEDDASDYLYVCSDFADPKLRTVKIRDLFSGGLRLFRDHRVFYNSPGFAGEIILKEKNSELTLRRSGMTKNDDWKIVKPYELATQPDAIKRLLGGLAALQAGAVLDESSISLPPPIPANIDFSISMSYFGPDGSLSLPVTAKFYPPQKANPNVVPVIISEGEDKKRAAVLLVPQGPRSLLASLPRDVNTLRSRTLTSLQVRQIKAVTIRDFTNRSVSLTLEKDPHERAQRWQAKIGRSDDRGQTQLTYQGPANLFQVKETFEALFRDEVENFTNDAVTDPANYGLDRPIRTINLTLRNDQVVRFVIGEKLQPQYFARRAAGGAPLEITEDAYLAGLEGQSHPQLVLAAKRVESVGANPTGLELLGLDRPKVVELDGVTLHLGKISTRHFFANRLDAEGKHTPHVVEVGASKISQIPLEAYHWRGARVWNVNRFDIKGVVIKKRGQPALELGYNFYAPSPWSATRQGKDVNALLNTNKATKLLEKITDIEVQKWIGPIAESAEQKLFDPDLTIAVLVEETNNEGLSTGLHRRELRFANTVSGQNNRLVFGKQLNDPDYFLIDGATFQRLSVELLEE